MANRPLERVGISSPPAAHIITKTVKVTRSDTTAFDAFWLPKGAVVSGAYVMGQTASDAATTAIVSLGSNPGTTDEVISAFSVKTNGAGYYAVTTTEGTKIGEQVTTDTLIKAKYTETGTASTTGGPWLCKVEYYIPQPGNSW